MVRKLLLALVAALVMTAVGAIAAWRLAPIETIAWAQAIVDPVGPARSISWAQGPAAEAQAPGARPPNIVFIVADDLGYNDITAFGGGIANGAVATPNIDSLARDGVVFANGYAGHATCAPSRAALMTGRFPARFGFQFNNTPGFLTLAAVRVTRNHPHARGTIAPAIFRAENLNKSPSAADSGLPEREITLPQVLRGRGYRTLMVGKWHLGESAALQPGARGFDEWLGFGSGGAMYLPKDDPQAVQARPDFDLSDKIVWQLSRPAVQKDYGKPFRAPRYMTDYFGDEAAAAIKANRNRPFFLYLAFNAPHTPLQALKSDYDALGTIPDHAQRVYGAMVRALDRNVGKVLAALKAQGLDENTLVVFTSDNGGTAVIGLGDTNKPYRGWKSTFFEGGIHTPFLMRWPARYPAGARVDAAVANVDLFSTAIAAAGGRVPLDRPIDGIDLSPLARNEGAAPERPLIWRAGPYSSVLMGGWKLQVADRPDRTWLYDLAADPNEKTNLAEKNPAKVVQLRALLAAYESTLPEPLWPILLERPVRIDFAEGTPVRKDQDYVYWAN